MEAISRLNMKMNCRYKLVLKSLRTKATGTFQMNKIEFAAVRQQTKYIVRSPDGVVATLSWYDTCLPIGLDIRDWICQCTAETFYILPNIISYSIQCSLSRFLRFDTVLEEMLLIRRRCREFKTCSPSKNIN